jgi:hypothetical protein
VLAVLWSAWNCQAQLASPFTVLSNNTDIPNQKLYVEIMYEKPACGDYQAQFRMVSNKGLDTVVAVDSFLNNPGTYQLSSDGKRLMRPQAGGYRLRFKLPAGAKPADSLRVCIDAYKMSYRCVGCAAGGSDAIFGPTDIDIFCPYNNAENDLLACYQRNSREQNWEAWVADPRDCQPYRVVLMPDNKWWFAQNLNYTKDLENSGNANKGLGGLDASSTNALWGNYWCPGGLTITPGEAQILDGKTQSPANTNITLTTGGMGACKTYGALYTWNTAIRLDGRGMEHSPTSVGVTSITQGICPEGWKLPSDADWGMMLNAVEGCSEFTESTTKAPCNHHHNDNKTSSWFGAKAAANLKSTLSGRPHSQLKDTIVATIATPSWPWHRADYDGKISAPFALGNDKYGFSLLPAGLRNSSTSSGGFAKLGNAAYLWSSTVNSNDRTIYRAFDYQHGTVYRNADPNTAQPKWAGFSIRCAREALPAVLGINAPDTISFLNSNIMVSIARRETTWSYTWSVESSEIANIASKVTFPTNGSSSAASVNSTLALEQSDANKSFTLKLTVNNGASTKTISKKIRIAALVVAIKINPYSVGGMVTATAEVSGSGRYSYAWGDGNMNFTQEQTNSQAIQTGGSGSAQTKTWHLRVKDLRTGVVSEQVTVSHTLPAIPTGAIFCNACGHNGVQNVDAWLDTMSDTGSLTSSSAYGLAGATDIYNGRLNTQRLRESGFASKMLYACIQKGAGWYVAAAEEYCRIKTAGLERSTVVDAEGSWLSTIQTASKDRMGISCWRPGEPSGNGPGLSVWSDFLLDDAGETTISKRVVCIWRPKEN